MNIKNNCSSQSKVGLGGPTHPNLKYDKRILVVIRILRSSIMSNTKLLLSRLEVIYYEVFDIEVLIKTIKDMHILIQLLNGIKAFVKDIFINWIKISKTYVLYKLKLIFIKNLIIFLIILKFVTPLISTLKLWLDTLEQDSSWQLLYSHLLLRKYLYKRDVCLVCNNPSSDGLAGIKILIVSKSHGRLLCLVGEKIAA